MRNPGQKLSNTRATNQLKGALYLVLALAAVGIPIVVWLMDPSWLGSTYGEGYAVFELFGLTGTLALITVAGLELRGRTGKS